MDVDIDLSKVEDQFCSKCKKKKDKYIGYIGTTPAVMFRSNCSCFSGNSSKTFGKSDKELFEQFSTPFWKMAGLKPKPKEIALEKYLKSKGMTYGDWRRERNYREAQSQGGLQKFQEHYKKYGRNNAPEARFQKTS